MSKLRLIRFRPIRFLFVAVALLLVFESPLVVVADSGPTARGAGAPPTAIGLPLILVPQPPATFSVDLKVSNPLDVARVGEPVTSGVPVPQRSAVL